MDLCLDAILSSSRYNFAIPVESGFLLYNSASGAVLGLSGRDAGRLAIELGGNPHAVRLEEIDDCLAEQLKAGGFLVDVRADEVAVVRERFREAVAGKPAVLTITTTMDCNLGCYYCYAERSGERLEVRQVEHVAILARNLLRKSGKNSLHVDWYGGEPLMNVEFLEHASFALQAICAELEIAYSSSVISNGTCWPREVEGFLRRTKIRQVQISFDGLRANHSKRRRFRKEYARGDETSSFDSAVRLVDELVQHVRVDLRFNIDRGNKDDVIPFVTFAGGRGWFAARHRVVFQPARLSSYTERSSFMRRVELNIEEYEEIRAKVRHEAEKLIAVEEAEVPDKFPYPRN